MCALFGKRVGSESRGDGKFLGDREKLSKQGVCGIARLDSRDEGTRSKERKILPCFPGRGNERVGQAKLPTQFSGISNCLLQLLLPGER